MFKLIKSKAFKLYFILSLSLIGYVVLGYFTPRTEFYILVLLFGILFLGYAYLISLELENRMIQQGIYAAILFRGMLLLMMPNLSDDIYRFVWDGNLLANGINPFLVLPSQFIQSTQAQQIGFNLELYQSLNSPEYYTIYPPVLQAVFYIAAKISSTHILGNVLVMRICILASEIGSIYLITKLLELFKLPSKNIFLYALNPLVIIELTGNIHFEAFLIFFLLLALYFMLKEKLMLSALAFALSVGSKLIPLMVLPAPIPSFSEYGFYPSCIFEHSTLCPDF
jgi:alpha-1,6-mannosyltransferase